MSDFGTERVPMMPPVPTAGIEAIGASTRGLFYDGGAEASCAIDLVSLVEQLPAYGIHVYPASAVELEDRLAATVPIATEKDETHILIQQSLWHELLDGGRAANRARATLAHELGHAILHVPILRRRMSLPNAETLLNRKMRRDEIPPYRDPEWQAWAFAGNFLAPRAAILASGENTVQALADRFEVSGSMMRSHLKRLKLLGRYE